MPICGDRMVTLGGFVCEAVTFVLHFDLQRSPERTFFVLRNVEFHHHVAIHRFGVGPCTRRTLNVVALTQGWGPRRIAGVIAPIGVQELCAV